MNPASSLSLWQCQCNCKTSVLSVSWRLRAVPISKPLPPLPDFVLPIIDVDPSGLSPSQDADSQNQSTSRRPLRPIRKPENGRILCANLVALVDHFLETDQKQFKKILLDTHRDYSTPEELFEVLIQRFGEVPQEMALSYYEKRHNIIEAIIAFLPSVDPDSEVLNVIRDFATATENLTPRHREMISKAIKSRSHRAIPQSYGESVKPSKLESYNIAVALTLMEAELRKSVRAIDYLLHGRGSPSRIDDLVSFNNKMACWLKSTILCHREIKTRADTIKQFVKTAKACLEMHNYNSAAVIGSVLLRWKSRPETDIPRTMAALESSTQESIEQLAKLMEPVDNFEAYKKTVVKEKAEAYIPWLPVLLADVEYLLANTARIIEVDDMQLINFERYRELANKVSGYQILPDLERKRKDKNIVYLRHQLDKAAKFDEKAEYSRLSKLKKQEDEDYEVRRSQLKSLGLQPSRN